MTKFNSPRHEHQKSHGFGIEPRNGQFERMREHEQEVGIDDAAFQRRGRQPVQSRPRPRGPGPASSEPQRLGEPVPLVLLIPTREIQGCRGRYLQYRMT